MGICVTDVYPKVFKSHTRQTVYLKLEGDVDSSKLSIKIQPMEAYAILRSERYRIDEEARYPYSPLTPCGDGLFCFEYNFTAEQRYSTRIRYNDRTLAYPYLYAVDEDLAALTPYKGDTHVHSCRSDGKEPPFEVACGYRAAGYDFIAITDHHKYAPSLEGNAAVSALTDAFRVFPGEEVHNKDMGYFHIVNFNGKSSVNDIIETDDAYVNAEIDRILHTRDLSGLSDPRAIAYRLFIAEHIRKAGGIAILAHPFWDTYGDYSMQTEDCIYHLTHGDFDALEVFAGCDSTGNGNNLQELLRTELMSEGFTIPVVGASDAHTVYPAKDPSTRFNRQFSIVFAQDFDDIPNAIQSERSVAVHRTNDTEFRAVGRYRYAKYARHLMQMYFPTYATLCNAHAVALQSGNREMIAAAECTIRDFTTRFFHLR